MALFTVEQKKVDELYTRKTQRPQYTPSNEKPPITALVDYEKYSKLMYNINNSNVSEEEKKFLRFGAARHLAFNYSLIADYYAHAEPEMQKLMEESALVIVDVDNAIANGFIKLTKELTDIIHGDEDEN